MSEPTAAHSPGPEDHFCHVWPVPGTSLPVEMNACVLSIMGAAEDCEAQNQQHVGLAFMWAKSPSVPSQPHMNILVLAKLEKRKKKKKDPKKDFILPPSGLITFQILLN